MSKSTLAAFKTEKQTQYTDELTFVSGKFTLSDMESVPYFTVVMPLPDLVNHINLVEDIPEEALLDWSLEELFQRDISWNRVEKELVNQYLKDRNKLSFFNSLTIALLPRNGFAIEKSYGKPDAKLPDKGEGWARIDVGNICVEFLSGEEIGVIRWHKERIFPVAIDGQHRLAALKAYYDEKKENLVSGSPELETKISLILLILDERVGFKRRDEKSLIETLREIFIDLNKNARPVSRSRLILLEDQNIQSLCVRTLLAKKAKELAEDELPLSIVTWRGDEVKDEAKFDSDYSITSVLNLNEIVKYCLNGASLDKNDPLVARKIKRYVDKVTGRLRLELNVKKSIINHSQECIEEAEPFSFKMEHLNALQEAFCQQWAPHIIRVFREFSPYKTYLSKAQEFGAVDGILADYLLLPEGKRVKFKNRKKMENREFRVGVEIDNPLKTLENLKKNEWAFQVVFQKALFINFFDLESQKQSLFGLSFNSKDEFFTWWIAQMNDLYEQRVFNLHWKSEKGKADLWLGIANNPGSGSIQYTQAAANRISSFITICMCFRQTDLHQEARKFVDSLINNKDQTLLIAQEAFKNIRKELESLIKAKMNADEIEDPKKLENQVKKEVVKRLKVIS